MYDFFIYLLQFTEHICYNISRTNDPQINVLQGENAMNYILGAFLLGTSAYCWKKFHGKDQESLWVQILCALMGIFSFLTAAPVNFFMGAVMIVLALLGAGCCYFQCRRSAQKRKKRSLAFSPAKIKKAATYPKHEVRSLGKAV